MSLEWYMGNAVKYAGLLDGSSVNTAVSCYLEARDHLRHAVRLVDTEYVHYITECCHVLDDMLTDALIKRRMQIMALDAILEEIGRMS